MSDFIPLPEGTDLSRIFRTRETRVSHGCTISYGGARYMMADADGVVLEVPDGTVLDVHADAVTEEMYVERSGRRWGCRPISPREPQTYRRHRTAGGCSISCRRCQERMQLGEGDIFAR